MTGNENTDSAVPETRGAGNLPLYSLVALFAAIAGFLSIVIVGQFGGGSGGNAPSPARAAATGNAETAHVSSGLDKLVRAREPKPVPAISFTGGDSGAHSLADWGGKVVLVNLWATWCAPCKKEMPSLDRLQAKLGGTDFAVLPISFDWSGADKPRAFLASNKLTNLPLYLDSSKTIMQALKAPGLPLSVLIDREGREVARLAGSAEWDSAEAEAMIRGVIDGKGGK